MVNGVLWAWHCTDLHCHPSQHYSFRFMYISCDAPVLSSHFPFQSYVSLSSTSWWCDIITIWINHTIHLIDGNSDYIISGEPSNSAPVCYNDASLYDVPAPICDCSPRPPTCNHRSVRSHITSLSPHTTPLHRHWYPKENPQTVNNGLPSSSQGSVPIRFIVPSNHLGNDISIVNGY